MAEARRKSRGVATGREGRRARRECRPRRRARPRHLACRGSTRRPAKNHRTRRQSSPRPRCASLRNENARRFVKNHITHDVDVPRRRRSATSPRARQRRRLARPGCSTRTAVSRGFTAPSEEKRAAKIGLASFATDRDAFPALRFHRAGRLRPARRPRHHRRSRPLSVRALLTAGAAYLSLSLPTDAFRRVSDLLPIGVFKLVAPHHAVQVHVEVRVVPLQPAVLILLARSVPRDGDRELHAAVPVEGERGAEVDGLAVGAG